MLKSTLIDGKSYSHGTTYRVSSCPLPASAGASSSLIGVRASSVKSIFARFAQGGAATTGNSSNGIFDSSNPSINSYAFNVASQKYPQNPVNPLLFPGNAMTNLQRAIGSFNNANFISAITPQFYCKLSAGGTNQGFGVASTQDYNWNTGSDPFNQSRFFIGENLEVCAKKGLLTGINATSAPMFFECNIAQTPTNAHTIYFIVAIDHIIIHNHEDGTLETRT
jgi:hypothetical protein